MTKRSVHFASGGWEDYIYWRKVDKKIIIKIDQLIEDTRRDPFRGIGKPEKLKENYSGYWSRRIDKEHRLVYMATEKELHIIACRFHYTK